MATAVALVDGVFSLAREAVSEFEQRRQPAIALRRRLRISQLHRLTIISHILSHIYYHHTIYY